MTSRYYDSCSKEDEIKPGKISNELRDALNIAANDLPIWIYRMRALGYPPGWLKKAIVDTSDIFDTDPTSDDVATEGSRKRKDPPSEEIQYDHSKLIEYPGFNAPLPENCVDYHYYVNMPAMLEYQQLEYAKQHMSAFKPAQIPKRIKKTDSSTNNDSSQSSDDRPVSPLIVDEIKLISKGSPMPKCVERAPLEKFSEGLSSELLFFENLPTTTGKFDSIRGLLNTMKSE